MSDEGRVSDDGLVSGPPPIPTGSATPIPSEPLTPIVLPSGAPTRSRVLLIAIAVAAGVALLLNIVGMAGFPPNAPAEQIYAFGICVDLLAVAVACGIGAVLARSRYPLRADSPVVYAAVVLAGVALVFWMLGGGLASVIQLFTPQRGRYMYASAGLFVGGAIWVLALVFGAYGYRRGGTRRNRVAATIALGVAGALAVYVVVSSVVYGLGLTN